MAISTNQADASSWWLAPAAVGLLAVVGFGVYWSQPDRALDEVPPEAMDLPKRSVPPPFPDQLTGVHSVSTGDEHGVRVVRIQVVPGGDELVVDAATGRLIEARPARPVSPPGKPALFAPFAPQP